MTDDLTPPQQSTADTAHAVARAVIGSVPLVGAAGAELFAYLVQEPYEKRRREWMREIGDAISDLRERTAIDIEALRGDPGFTDTVLAATQAALRTRSSTKREALRNAVLNSALPAAPDESERQRYLRLIDDLSEWHLSILAVFQDPAEWFKRHGIDQPSLYMGGLSHVLEAAYPQLRGRRDHYDHWWRELHQRGLVNTESLHAMMSQHGLMASRVTAAGERFLRFTEAPE